MCFSCLKFSLRFLGNFDVKWQESGFLDYNTHNALPKMCSAKSYCENRHNLTYVVAKMKEFGKLHESPQNLRWLKTVSST